MGRTLYFIFAAAFLLSCQLPATNYLLAQQESSSGDEETKEKRAVEAWQRLHRHSVERSIDTNLLFSLLDNKEAWDALEFTDSQKKELREAYREANREISRRLGFAFDGNQETLKSSSRYSELGADEKDAIDNLLQKRNDRLKEVLLSFQGTSLVYSSLKYGLPLAIVDSPVTTLIDLTEPQKQAFIESANQTADKVEQRYNQLCLRIVDTLRQELTEKQWEKLEQIYGTMRMKSALFSGDLSLRIQEFRLWEPEYTTYKAWAEQHRRKVGTSLDSFLLFSLFEDEKAWDALELTDTQKEDLRTTFQDVNQEVSERLGFTFNGNNNHELRASPKYCQLPQHEQDAIMDLIRQRDNRLIETLLPHQAKALANGSLRFGLLLAIVDSPTTSLIELTEPQKKRIIKSAKKTADEVEELVNQMPAEVLEVIQRGLTKQQWSKLEQIYGKEKLEGSVLRRPPSTLVQDLRLWKTHYSRPEYPTPNN